MDGNTTQQHEALANAAEIMPSTPFQTATDPVSGQGRQAFRTPVGTVPSSSFQRTPSSKSSVDPSSLEAGTRESNELGSVIPRDRGFWGNFKDSFKRAELPPPKSIEMTEGAQGVIPGVTPTPAVGFDHRAAAEKTANSGLDRALKSRHMQMIAIGGSIGKSML